MSYTKEEIAREAIGLREQMGLSMYEVVGDLINLVEESGHKIKYEDFGNSFTAALVYLGRGRFSINLNKPKIWNKKFERFTIAHELGHVSLFEHQEDVIKNGKRLELIDEFKSEETMEKEADSFAINFLAPESLFKKIAGGKFFNKYDIDQLSRTLNISFQSCVFRFLELTSKACSVVLVDNKDQKIIYDFRSKKMRRLNKHPSICGEQIIPNSFLSRFTYKNRSIDQKERIIDLSEYYQDYKAGMTCKESLIKFNYNSTTMILISESES
ncbi:MAG TPA: hypothetical protein DCL80_02995 [Balneola sp.]|nr:hypothetical protein [Balneola sp.]MAO78715.1 hypothetical protein [Balneola sp.]MBF64770.1 hypothetical protein [Balneola sp.]HAH50265.1 hypothetical protein [Balneola sp.]HAW80225.1 hypothetical protein [Balneola sp.]|tara:strand:+ start:9119 stop:9928 length:810 start_codon:yes stop_codon:yes gene_type:complete